MTSQATRAALAFRREFSGPGELVEGRIHDTVVTDKREELESELRREISEVERVERAGKDSTRNTTITRRGVGNGR